MNGLNEMSMIFEPASQAAVMLFVMHICLEFAIPVACLDDIMIWHFPSLGLDGMITHVLSDVHLQAPISPDQKMILIAPNSCQSKDFFVFFFPMIR
jgi:hypothetical protein